MSIVYIHTQITRIDEPDACLRTSHQYSCESTMKNLDRSGLEPTQGQQSFSFPNLSIQPTQPLIEWVPGLFTEGIDRGVAVTTHPHPVPRLIMGTATPLPLP